MNPKCNCKRLLISKYHKNCLQITLLSIILVIYVRLKKSFMFTWQIFNNNKYCLFRTSEYNNKMWCVKNTKRWYICNVWKSFNLSRRDLSLPWSWHGYPSNKVFATGLSLSKGCYCPLVYTCVQAYPTLLMHESRRSKSQKTPKSTAINIKIFLPLMSDARTWNQDNGVWGFV